MPESAPVLPPNCQQLLAFDFGTKRTGVASGNLITRSATPQPTIAAEGDARFVQIAQRIRDWTPQALVVGVPYYRQLRGRFGLPVFEVDERYSTTEALASGAKDADASSACIILEQFLRSLP
jgi:putative Holliday junction resolvase